MIIVDALLIAGVAYVRIRSSAKATAEKASKEDSAHLRGQAKKNPVLLHWRDLTVTLRVGKKKDAHTRFILRNIKGVAKPGRLLAIMGPSGSGKTTLLNSLACQLPRNERMHAVGTVLVNGKPIMSSDHAQAYVKQQDLFYSQLTARETLNLAAALRLPKSFSQQKRDEYVDDLINKLGLTKSADTIVGDEKVRGLSGGERKRLSIGCELISGPQLMFVDEPTSGLDSFQAEKVMSTMRRLAHDGHTVLCTIHQPSSTIFSMFDDLMLLSEGEMVYFGTAKSALDHFALQGFPCPEHFNPAEYFADLISVDYSSDETRHKSKERIKSLIEAFARKMARESTNGAEDEDVGSSGNGQGGGSQGKASQSTNTSWWEQFKLLLHRSWRQATRDKTVNIVRVMINVTSAIIFGSIYWQLGLSQAALQSRLGLFQMAAVSAAMQSLSKVLNVFPKERAIVQEERAKKSYTVLPYFLSKLLAELPVSAIFPTAFASVLYPMAGLNPSLPRFLSFLGVVILESFTSSAVALTIGAIAPSVDAALAMGPSIMLIFILFGGYSVNEETVPRILRWIPNVSLIRWGFEGMCVSDLRGLQFECSAPVDVATGDQVLQRLSFQHSSVWKTMVAQVRIMLFCYGATYAVLSMNKPAFLPLEQPRRVVIEEITSSPPAPHAAHLALPPANGLVTPKGPNSVALPPKHAISADSLLDALGERMHEPGEEEGYETPIEDVADIS